MLIVMIFFQNTNLLISEFDDFISTHIFSEFYQNSLKHLHSDKIITISWLLLSYSENIENNWNYVLIIAKSPNSDDNGHDNNAPCAGNEKKWGRPNPSPIFWYVTQHQKWGRKPQLSFAESSGVCWVACWEDFGHKASSAI